MICKYFEYKVVSATHWHSRHIFNANDMNGELHTSTNAFAIITTSKLIAEPDAIPCVRLEKADDMYVIARDLNDAGKLLEEALIKGYAENVIAVPNGSPNSDVLDTKDRKAYK